MDRATANLPSAALDRTAAFYTALGFVVSFKDDGWMILATLSVRDFQGAPCDLNAGRRQDWFASTGFRA